MRRTLSFLAAIMVSCIPLLLGADDDADEKDETEEKVEAAVIELRDSAELAQFKEAEKSGES